MVDRIASYERVLRTSTFDLGFNVTGTPEYYTCFDYVPDLSNLLENGTAPQPLIDVTFTSSVDILRGDVVTYLGIVAAAIFWWGNRTPADSNIGAFDWGNFGPPTLGLLDETNILQPVAASVAYQSVPLPIAGGVNYPIWSQSASDPLTTRMSLGRTGPRGQRGFPWVQTIVQVVGNVDAPAIARATLSQRWAPADS